MNINKVPNQIKRQVQIGDWIFEVKMVRAIKVAKYGEPYRAIANLCLNDNNAYIDGLLLKDQQQLSKTDRSTFMQFCSQMSVLNVNINEALSAQPSPQPHLKTAPF